MRISGLAHIRNSDSEKAPEMVRPRSSKRAWRHDRTTRRDAPGGIHRWPWLSLGLLALLGVSVGRAGGSPDDADARGGVVSEVPLGLVRVNARERSVSFPASVNQRTGLVEYVVVTSTGKTHESVLRTDAEPQHIHLGLLLLGAHPANTPVFPADPGTPPPGEPIHIDVVWQAGGKEVSHPIEDLVVTTNRWQALGRGSWTYNGSYLSDRRFVAQQEGSIVALQIDPSALVNNPRHGRENDELHHVNPALLLPDNTPLRVRIRLERPLARAPVSDHE